MRGHSHLGISPANVSRGCIRIDQTVVCVEEFGNDVIQHEINAVGTLHAFDLHTKHSYSIA